MKLILSDGSIFSGHGFGFPTSSSGELIFNTGMTGYPETMTDPSYFGQIIVFTFPLIGNYGIPKSTEEGYNKIITNFESDKIHTKGIVVSSLSENYSHFDAESSLSKWMYENKIPGITDVDTRALTIKIREKGTVLGKLVHENEDIEFYDPNNHKIIPEVSIKEPIEYSAGSKKIILVDTGLKLNILRSMLKRNISVLRVPWNYDYSKEKFDGVLLSNGPGDPAQAMETVENLQKVLSFNKPILGICLGHQMLAMVAGAKTYKLKYGHHSQNQPCVEVGAKKGIITSQNHGYAVDEKTLGNDWKPWFFNANDGSNEGIRHALKPFRSVQFHPEAVPGPTDANYLFDEFVSNL